MAVKTITIDLEAYEILASRKKPGQSFSRVIKETLGTARKGRDLRDALRDLGLAPRTLEAVDEQVKRRRASRARAIRL